MRGRWKGPAQLQGIAQGCVLLGISFGGHVRRDKGLTPCIYECDSVVLEVLLVCPFPMPPVVCSCFPAVAHVVVERLGVWDGPSPPSLCASPHRYLPRVDRKISVCTLYRYVTCTYGHSGTQLCIFAPGALYVVPRELCCSEPCVCVQRALPRHSMGAFNFVHAQSCVTLVCLLPSSSMGSLIWCCRARQRPACNKDDSCQISGGSTAVLGRGAMQPGWTIPRTIAWCVPLPWRYCSCTLGTWRASALY